MRIFKKILVLLVLMVILFYGKEVYAAEKYSADDYIFFDPISTNTCNEKNYWTYYNQNTTCFRFMVLNNNDNTTNTTIKLLLDHDLGADTFANYKTVLNNNTANWTHLTTFQHLLNLLQMVFTDNMWSDDEFPVLMLVEEGDENLFVRLPTATCNKYLLFIAESLNNR